jgi:hypothetical protein
MGRMQLLERNYHKGVAVERTFVVHRIHESIRLLNLVSIIKVNTWKLAV